MNKLILSAALLITTAATAFAGAPAQGERHVLPDSVQWAQPYGPQGPSFGFVEGKFGDKKPASFFVKMAAGGDSGWHTHSETYEAVVLKGTFTEQQQGEAAETQLPAGTYFSQSSKANHRNGCLKGEDCVVYVHFAKGADSHPTRPDGKPLPAPKS